MVQIVPLKMKRLKLLFPDEDMLDLLTVWLLKQALFDSLTGSSAFVKGKKKEKSCLNKPGGCQPVIAGVQVKFRINRRNVALQS